MRVKDRLWHLLLVLVKRWTRAGLLSTVTKEILQFEITKNVVSVGGFGPVDYHLQDIAHLNKFKLTSFDINPAHQPDILADIQELNRELINRSIEPNIILALEVLEHVPDPFVAINECFNALTPKGVLILSTPWIIPIHDAPHDYWRFTPEALRKLTRKFEEVEIIARGDEFDSVIALMLRGIFGKGTRYRFLLMLGIVLSVILPVPKIYTKSNLPQSTIGYIVIARKN